jgi:NTE family protein
MQIRNLVFEGGGIKGVAYSGALQGLIEEIDINEVTRVGGTSAGALFSLLFALNYSVSEIQDILLHLNFKQFMDDDFGFIRDTGRLLNEFGWYKGDAFSKWIREIVLKKTGDPNTSFAQLKAMSYKGKQIYRDLYIIGSNLNTGNAEVFSYESKHAEVPIALATRISGSIPVFFRPIYLNNAYYVDGGVIRNYPITLFDDWKYNPNIPNETVVPFNQETLGLRLDSQAEIKRFLDPSVENREYNINNFFDYAHALIGMINRVQDEAHFHSFDQFRTIYCDTLGIGVIDFDISLDKRKQLLTSGYSAVKEYFTEGEYQKRLKQRKIYQRDTSLFQEVAILGKQNQQHWVGVQI